jgi:hypothetical protein
MIRPAGHSSSGSPADRARFLTAFLQGVRETGYVEGQNVAIEYRWAQDQADRLRALATDLVQLRVAAIVTPGMVSTLAAKAATTSIPIVFGLGKMKRCVTFCQRRGQVWPGLRISKPPLSSTRTIGGRLVRPLGVLA